MFMAKFIHSLQEFLVDVYEEENVDARKKCSVDGRDVYSGYILSWARGREMPRKCLDEVLLTLETVQSA